MSRPDPDRLRRARRFYDLESLGSLGGAPLGDLAVVATVGVSLIPTLVRDADREERATRHWFAHREGGWTPTDIVLRSSLYECDIWYDPRGRVST